MQRLEKVREIIADALYVELDEVQAGSSLMKDLGAESIDFLDIVFRLEKEFNVKLPKGDLEKRAREGMTEEEFAVGGRLTDTARARLKQLMPEVDPASFADGLLVRDIPSLFNVATFDGMVAAQLGETEAAVPAGTATTTKSVQANA